MTDAKIEERLIDAELLLRRLRSELAAHSHSTIVEGTPPAVPVDHGSLGGLNDDDHLQYLDNSRHATMSLHAIGVVVPHDDHGLLTGLGDDDHTQYLNTTRHAAITHDHGGLGGLADDDHPQYLLINGTRKMTGSLLPNATDQYDLGSSTYLWRKGYLSELDAVVFAQQTVTLVGGWLIVGKDEGAYPADVTAGSTQINFGKTMTTGDYVLMRSVGKVEYIQIGSLVSGTTYNVTRNLDGSGANDWPAGTPFSVMGQNGNGWIELNAYDTPRLSIFKHNGGAYNARTEVVRIGDLNGWDSGGTERYGVGLGDFAGGNYLKYDGSVFELKGGAGGVTIDGSGIQLGSSSGSLGNTTSIRFSSSLMAGAYLFSAGEYATTGFELKGTLDTSDTFIRYIPRTWYEHNEWVMNAGKDYSGRPSRLSVGGFGASYGANKSYVDMSADEIRLSANHNPSDGAPSIVANDVASLPPTPASSKTSLYFRNGIPIIKRSSGYAHPLVASDELLMQLPYACIWSFMKNLSGVGWRVIDTGGANHHLTMQNMGQNTTPSVIGGAGHAMSQMEFNGTNAYAYLSDVTSIVISQNAMMGGCWFYRNNTSAYNGLMVYGETTPAYWLLLEPTNTVLFRRFDTTGAEITFLVGGVNVGWNFAAFYASWNNSSSYSFRFFVNGSWSSYSGAANNNNRMPAGQFRLGNWSGYHLSGRMHKAFSCWPGSYGPDTVQEYYAMTKNHFQ